MDRKIMDLAEVVEIAKQLPLLDKVRLIVLLAPLIERDLLSAQPGPRRSLLGLCSDLGPAPSAEDIDEARRQEWAGFPRKDI